MAFRGDGRTYKRWTMEARWQENKNVMRLTLRWMFETAVGDGAQELSLEQKVTEAGRMNTDIAALLVGTTSGYRQVALLRGSVTVGGRS